MPPDIFVYDDLPPVVREAVREFPMDLNCANLLPALVVDKIPPEVVAEAINKAAQDPEVYNNLPDATTTGRVGDN